MYCYYFLFFYIFWYVLILFDIFPYFALFSEYGTFHWHPWAYKWVKNSRSSSSGSFPLRPAVSQDQSREGSESRYCSQGWNVAWSLVGWFLWKWRGKSWVSRFSRFRKLTWLAGISTLSRCSFYWKWWWNPSSHVSFQRFFAYLVRYSLRSYPVIPHPHDSKKNFKHHTIVVGFVGWFCSQVVGQTTDPISQKGRPKMVSSLKKWKWSANNLTEKETWTLLKLHLVVVVIFNSFVSLVPWWPWGNDDLTNHFSNMLHRGGGNRSTRRVESWYQLQGSNWLAAAL